MGASRYPRYWHDTSEAFNDFMAAINHAAEMHEDRGNLSLPDHLPHWRKSST